MSLDVSRELVSLERGELDRRIFSDQDIFDQEMELIFGRAWIFVAHETMIAKTGDFFEAPMGKDNVLVVRQQGDGSVKAFLNTCTHHGNAVFHAEEGNTKNFMCTYHGWTFDLAGKLVGVPGFENLYHSDLDKDSLGLREVAQIDIYKGFVFATMDPTAPPLLEYLGATGRLGIDFLAERGDMEVIPGVRKFVIDCNWKFSADNIFDMYHGPVTHVSATVAYATAGIRMGKRVDILKDPVKFRDDSPTIDDGGAAMADGSKLAIQHTQKTHQVMVGEFGHAIGGAVVEAGVDGGYGIEEWRERPEAQKALGPIGLTQGGHPSIFPNFWPTGTQLIMRVPRSPSSTEMWMFGFVDKNAPEEVRRENLIRLNHVFGPAGFHEQDDGENWSQATRQTHGLVSQTIPQQLKMNVGRGKIIKEGGFTRIEGTVNEHAQLWLYNSWAKWMTGMDWEDLKSSTMPGEIL